jgi:hypothetical protein
MVEGMTSTVQSHGKHSAFSSLFKWLVWENLVAMLSGHSSSLVGEEPRSLASSHVSESSMAEPLALARLTDNYGPQ